MKIIFKLLTVLLVVTLAGCGSQDTGDGNLTEGPDVQSILLTSDKDSVTADGSDVAQLTVRALDADNAAVAEAEISLSTTQGALSSGLVTTDESGIASVSFDSGAVQRNGLATITASSGSASYSMDISIVGTRATLESDRATVGLNGSSQANLLVEVLNSSGDPVRNEPVTLTAELGLIDGQASATYQTDSAGKVAAVYTGGSEPGVDNISMTGPDEKNLLITITGGEFSLTDTRSGVFNFSATNSLVLVWTDDEGAPVADEDVLFSCSKCRFSESANNFITLTTDVDGKIQTYLTPVSVGPDTVTAAGTAASGEEISTSLPLTILADAPSRLILNIDPTVVARAQGDNQPSATVTATVFDNQNRAVQEIDVAFSIQSGPGGSSELNPVVATTNSAGTATTTFFSGGLTSAQNGVVIQARVVSEPSIEDSKTLTVAAQPAFISIGEGNVIEGFNVPTQVGSSELYALPFNLLVTDTNGNPIADQTVSLGLYPFQFRTGLYTDPFDSDTYFSLGTFANEDTNRNGILDAGEDGAIGSIFRNNQLDPGNVATLPASVVTDENGFAGFSVVYAKSYANWVDVELSAATSVSGTEYRSVINVPLTAELGDTPFLDSPFGTGEVVAPSVVSTSPANGQTNVSSNADVLISFDRPMDKDTVNLTNISTVCDDLGFQFGDVISNSTGTRFTLRQFSNVGFPADTFCEVTVSTNVRDLVNGSGLASPYRFSFRVVPEDLPFNEVIYTGTGSSLEDTFVIPEGPARIKFAADHLGSGDFTVNLVDISDFENPVLIFEESGETGEETWEKELILDAGSYYLDIQADEDADWTVGVTPRD